MLTKLVLTTITMGLGLFSLRPGVMEAYGLSGPGGDPDALDRAGLGLIYAGSVSTTTYLVITVDLGVQAVGNHPLGSSKGDVMTTTRNREWARRIPAAGSYRIDPSRCSVILRTRHMFGLAAVTGTMAVTGGDIRVDSAGPHASVRATLEAASIDTGNRRRDRDVRSARFLHTERYPDITFRASALDRADGRWTLTGELTVRDVTQPVTLVVSDMDLRRRRFSRLRNCPPRPIRVRRHRSEGMAASLPGRRAGRGGGAAVTANLAEGVGFEPTVGDHPTAVFKTAALGHYASPPDARRYRPCGHATQTLSRLRGCDCGVDA